MKIQYLHLYQISTLPGKHLTVMIVLCLLITLAPNSFATSKRVAVLYFEDHSRFDSPTGCGCLPTGPFNKIFGGRKDHTKWHLKEGFRELLNRKLKQTDVYEPVTQDELMDAMAYMGLSKKIIQSDAKKRGELAKALNVDALIVGDIRKFNQERVKAHASRLLRGGRQQRSGSASYVSGIQLIGSLYIASVHLDMRFYGTSGVEIDNPKISARRQHQFGGAKVAALEAIVTEQGTEFQFGQMPRSEKKFRPIVKPAALNKIEFGSAEYDKTLFGITTNEALDKVVLALRENIGPEAIASDAVAQNDGSKSGESVPQVAQFRGQSFTSIRKTAKRPISISAPPKAWLCVSS
jgi:hypothetical protein